MFDIFPTSFQPSQRATRHPLWTLCYSLWLMQTTAQTNRKKKRKKRNRLPPYFLFSLPRKPCVPVTYRGNLVFLSLSVHCMTPPSFVLFSFVLLALLPICVVSTSRRHQDRSPLSVWNETPIKKKKRFRGEGSPPPKSASAGPRSFFGPSFIHSYVHSESQKTLVS